MLRFPTASGEGISGIFPIFRLTRINQCCIVTSKEKVNVMEARADTGEYGKQLRVTSFEFQVFQPAARNTQLETALILATQTPETPVKSVKTRRKPLSDNKLFLQMPISMRKHLQLTKPYVRGADFLCVSSAHRQSNTAGGTA